MIKEVIIVEGKQDIIAVKKAVDAEIISTDGFSLKPHCLRLIELAYCKRGIIILTDPDNAGNQIRKFLSTKFLYAKHAFVAKSCSSENKNIGVEYANPESIRNALAKAGFTWWNPEIIFFWEDIIDAGLTGTTNASEKRAKIGKKLGIGYANAKIFLYRLNHYGITRENFLLALSEGC